MPRHRPARLCRRLVPSSVFLGSVPPPRVYKVALRRPLPGQGMAPETPSCPLASSFALCPLSFALSFADP